ncbi:hypothetical protein [Bacillus halotolerans]|nr:hypothetical protein [Bacillus halotolerans]
MFQTMRIGDWVIEADVEETRRQYAKILRICANVFFVKMTGK